MTKFIGFVIRAVNSLVFCYIYVSSNINLTNYLGWKPSFVAQKAPCNTWETWKTRCEPCGIHHLSKSSADISTVYYPSKDGGRLASTVILLLLSLPSFFFPFFTKQTALEQKDLTIFLIFFFTKLKILTTNPYMLQQPGSIIIIKIITISIYIKNSNNN